MRKLLAIAALSCVAVVADSPADVFSKAPPEIDRALRGRVATFFQAHVDQKFRNAEAVIAEDSLDHYYNSKKTPLISFEIIKVDYSDNFTKATVVTAVELDWLTPELGRIRVKPPMKSTWKRENGEWWWYVVPQKTFETPFGRMTPGPDPTGAAKPRWTGPNTKDILNSVRASKTEIRLRGYEKSEDFAEITNSMPGEVTLRVDQPQPVSGLEITLDRETLKSGETARVTFTYSPPDPSAKRSLSTTITVSPTGRSLPFKVVFAIPPELEKQLPKLN